MAGATAPAGGHAEAGTDRGVGTVEMSDDGLPLESSGPAEPADVLAGVV